jgi:hypothetical protein
LVLIEQLLAEGLSGSWRGKQAKWAVKGMELSNLNSDIQMLSLGSFSFLPAKLTSPCISYSPWARGKGGLGK